MTLLAEPLAATKNHPQVFDGFTEAELDGFFKQVQNCQDWKAPICAQVLVGIQETGIDTRLLRGLVAAVEFFTATKAAATVDYRHDKKSWFALITADGYRMGPAGDH